MPSNLPALDKTWQFFHGVNAPSASYKDRLFEFKTALIGFALSPWVVASSSNGAAFGNNDDVDHWASTADMVTNSWVVLRQPGLGATAQLMIRVTNATAQTVDLAFNSFGFGAANGGTDGTATVAPLPAVGTGLFGSSKQLEATAGTNHRMEICMSTDGAVTRSNVIQSGSDVNNETTGWIDIELLKNPTPSVKFGGVSGAGFIRFPQLDNNPNSFARSNDVTARQWGLFDDLGGAPLTQISSECYQSTIGEVAAMTAQNLLGPNNFEGAFEFYPIWLRSNNLGFKGILGVRFDRWYGSTASPHGTTFPAPPDTPANQFIQFSDHILPWDGTPSNIPF